MMTGMPANVFSTAFKQQRLGLMFSVVLILMVYLGTLAIAAQAVLARTAWSWGYDLQSRMTVEIPFIPDEEPEAKSRRRDAVLAAVRAVAEVRTVAPLDEAQTRRLLRSWIEDSSLLEALPLPQLVDVTLKDGAELAPQALSAAVSAGGGGFVHVYGHAEWMRGLLGFLSGLGAIAALMLALTAFAVVAVISVVCRAALAVQHDTIELLHFMGAPDHALARQFQRHIRTLAVPASSIGFLLAAFTIALLAFLFGSFGGLSLIAVPSWFTLVGVMTLVPLGAVGLSILAAHFSLVKLLRRLG